ncbi:EAL and HDOD domain-containing protein [Jidongwangia harbinensis]|uniref:EAL and HDOD domain-containing protein n=1 Tax=Jidongwangia harbinensis TaxID=2878561 RepID=UPI001CD958D1|nr:HDOD domain-containing protein [Jidongwangia harbinensis]MCA2213223.1 HDOD domain-containing protein [Jidongwangia harbinensis]
MNSSVTNAPGAHLVHVGRQPIFDRSGDVVAYELLFRGSVDAVEAGRQDTYATSQVIVNAFTEFGIGEVAGDRLCFINLTREFLTGELTVPFGPDRMVLEVLETVQVDDAVIAGVTALAANGYRIALDDFVWGSGHEQLLGLASYVKLDLLDGDLSGLGEVVAGIRRYPGVQIVAERLETAAQLALADRYDLELRQGYALSRPQVLSAASLTPSRLRRLELLGALSSPDANLETILSIVASDPALSLRVLRACNSAAAGGNSRISSVRQAVVLVGLAQIRQWSMLMVIDDVAEATDDQMIAALTRARLSENVAPMLSAPADSAFMAGLISGVADLLGLSNAALADQLPLAAELKIALAERGGSLGRVLQVVDAYEAGNLRAVARMGDTDRLVGSYLDAMRWSARTVHATSQLAAR